MDERLELLQNWNKMLDGIEKARKCWEKLASFRFSIDPSGVDPTMARAMTIACNSRNFDVFLPDLIRYWRTHGGIEAIIVPKELINSFKELEEKEKD